jgi:hypothetical protein
MSCGCNGSSSPVNTGLNNAFTVNNGYSQVNNNGYSQVNNNGYSQVNNNGFTQAVVNPLNNNYSSLVGATYMAMSTAEQSYTYNPQVTSVPGIQPVNLSVRSMNYVPSFTVPVLSSQTGFVNYNVRSTPTYVNTCN